MRRGGYWERKRRWREVLDALRGIWDTVGRREWVSKAQWDGKLCSHEAVNRQSV